MMLFYMRNEQRSRVLQAWRHTSLPLRQSLFLIHGLTFVLRLYREGPGMAHQAWTHFSSCDCLSAFTLAWNRYKSIRWGQHSFIKRQYADHSSPQRTDLFFSSYPRIPLTNCKSIFPHNNIVSLLLITPHSSSLFPFILLWTILTFLVPQIYLFLALWLSYPKVPSATSQVYAVTGWCTSSWSKGDCPRVSTFDVYVMLHFNIGRDTERGLWYNWQVKLQWWARLQCGFYSGNLRCTGGRHSEGSEGRHSEEERVEEICWRWSTWYIKFHVNR